MVVKWSFLDTFTSETYTFEINPDAGAAPMFDKNITFEGTVAPDGRNVMFEGKDKPTSFDFSGTIITQAQYNAFVTWSQKHHQVHLTDDLGRTWVVYITSFQPVRVRSSNFWKHTYTMKTTVLNWP